MWFVLERALPLAVLAWVVAVAAASRSTTADRRSRRTRSSFSRVETRLPVG